MEIKDERICGSQTYLRRNHKKAKGTTTDNYAIINEDLSAYLFFILLSTEPMSVRRRELECVCGKLGAVPSSHRVGELAFQKEESSGQCLPGHCW